MSSITSRGTERVLYFECNSGISADMALGALIDLGADVKLIENALKSIRDVRFNFRANKIHRNGIAGTSTELVIYDNPQHDHDYYETDNDNKKTHDSWGSDNDLQIPGNPEHEASKVSDVISHGKMHNSLAGVKQIIDNAEVTPKAKKYAHTIFETLGKAEAAVHGTTLDAVMFHEVGAIDSVIDVLATVVAVDMLGIERIYCGPLYDGMGEIKCAHGMIPVPVPVVLEMAKSTDIPIVVDSSVTTEMVTPTGYSILIGIGAIYKPKISITPEAVGYGFGKRDTGKFGAVRAIIGIEEAL